VTLDGAASVGSVWLGRGTSGSLEVNSAANSLTAAGNIDVGAGGVPSSTGTSAGQGDLSVSGGGVVSGNHVLIGAAQSVGSVEVSGAGSQLNATSLVVGEGGLGSLVVDPGGVVTAQSTQIGEISPAVGTVEVEAGVFNAGKLSIGSSGTAGDVRVVGSTLSSSDAQVGVYGNGSVAVDVLSAWNNTGELDIGGGGSVTVEDYSILTADSLLLQSGGSLILDPSDASVTGDFTLDSGGSLALDIAGDMSDLISQLDIAGTGTFDGIIDLNFIDGFAPTSGTFDLINVPSADFSLATIDVTGLQPDIPYSYKYADGEFTLTVGEVGSPEPGSFWLADAALAGVALGLLRKRIRAGA
jgi:T5SS/PEP-CTERM-associated repeat protein